VLALADESSASKARRVPSPIATTGKGGEMGDFADPNDAASLWQSAASVNEAVAELREIAEPRGYGVDGGTDGAVADHRVRAEPLDTEPSEWFVVFPLDKPDARETFGNADAARDYMQWLPRPAADLE
jgi:hypothetical protein